jgi:hypothetical protein
MIHAQKSCISDNIFMERLLNIFETVHIYGYIPKAVINNRVKYENLELLEGLSKTFQNQKGITKEQFRECFTGINLSTAKENKMHILSDELFGDYILKSSLNLDNSNVKRIYVVSADLSNGLYIQTQNGQVFLDREEINHIQFNSSFSEDYICTHQISDIGHKVKIDDKGFVCTVCAARLTAYIDENYVHDIKESQPITDSPDTVFMQQDENGYYVEISSNKYYVHMTTLPELL